MEILHTHKHVRFNPLIKYNSTMGKILRQDNSMDVPSKETAKAKRVHRISGFKQFCYDVECWDTTAVSDPQDNRKWK